MKLNRTLFAAAALAAAPAFAQTPPVQNRTEIPAPREGRIVAAQAGAAAPVAGQGQVVERPVAGRSVPAPAVGAVGGQVATQGAVGGQIATRPGAVAVNATGTNDALFAAAAADSGLAELTLSQLGAQRATDPELKRFSQQMIDEHTRMNNELRAICAQKGMRIPEMVDVRAQFCAQSLAGLSGEEFDKCYAKAQLVAHMDAVAAFEAEAERGLDPNIKALAARALPKIKAHLEQIEPIAERYCEKGKGKEKSESAEHSRIGKPGGQPIR